MINPFESLDKRQSNIENILHELSQTVKELKQDFEPKQPTELLTRKEVAELLKCDLSTIFHWVKKGKLVQYGIQNRVYFKRSEIEAVLIPLNKKGGKDE